MLLRITSVYGFEFKSHIEVSMLLSEILKGRSIILKNGRIVTL